MSPLRIGKLEFVCIPSQANPRKIFPVCCWRNINVKTNALWFYIFGAGSDITSSKLLIINLGRQFFDTIDWARPVLAELEKANIDLVLSNFANIAIGCF